MHHVHTHKLPHPHLIVRSGNKILSKCLKTFRSLFVQLFTGNFFKKQYLINYKFEQDWLHRQEIGFPINSNFFAKECTLLYYKYPHPHPLSHHDLDKREPQECLKSDKKEFWDPEKMNKCIIVNVDNSCTTVYSKSYYTFIIMNINRYCTRLLWDEIVHLYIHVC